MIQPRLEVDAAVGVGREVLDVAGKNLVVPHKGANIVRGVNGGAEKPDFLHRAGDISGTDKVPHFKGF